MTAKKNGASPDKRRKYDEAFKVEDLRLASESRGTQVASWQLGATEVRTLRARLKWAEQELDILKKALVIFGQPTR